MKVLLICKALHFTYKGGIQTHVWELSKALLDQGMEVHLLAGGKPSLQVHRRNCEGRTIIELPTLPGHRIRWFSSTLDEIAFNFQVVRWLANHHQEYDIIHLHGRSGLFWPIFFPRHSGNCLLTMHGLTVEEWQFNRKNFDRWLHSRLANWAERLAVKRLSMVLAVSLDQANRIQQRFGRSSISVQVIPNGIAERPHAPFPEESWVCFAGRMERIKGVDLLPGMLAALPAGVNLFMIGQGPEIPSLKKAFAALGLEKRVVWTGAIDPEEVLGYMARSQVLVVPSRYEPQGRVILEAMSIGRPFVANQVGGIPDMVRDGQEGILLAHLDQTTLADAVELLISQPEKAESMGIHGRMTVRKHFSWSGLGPEFISMYRRLLSQPTLFEDERVKQTT